MVHNFKFSLKDKTYHFLWDVESGSLHNVDKDSYIVAVNRYGAPDETEKEAYKSMDTTLVDEINAEFSILEGNGTLDSLPPRNPVIKKQYGVIKALCLHICHDCNLRCKYCFANDGTYNTARDYMSAEVGKKAVDFLIANSGDRRNLEIDFFGGEPLMNMGAVKEIVAYARSKEKQSDKSFSFTVTTNCLLLNDESIDFINKEVYNVVLSIDGRESVHDNVRKSVNGKPCYDVILRNALKLVGVRGNKSYYVRGTFTHGNLDFVKDVECLRDAGFDQISLEPVVLDCDNELAITKEDLPRILNEYERLAEFYLDSRKNGKWFNFFHFMLDLENGPCINKRLTGCGAGSEYLAVTPTGDVYPCHQFAGDGDNRMGNLYGKVEISDKYSTNVVNNKKECASCIAKYYCSGGCMANNIRFTGDMNKPYGQSCEMMRKRFELSLAIAAIESSYA